MELEAKAKEIALKHVKALVEEMMTEIAFPALKEAAAKSATPIDDMVLAALETPLKEAIKAQLAKI